MAYAIPLVLAGIAVYWVIRRRRSPHAQPIGDACPRCGGRLVYRQRTFRGSAQEQYWECSVGDCGYRKSV